MSEFYDALETRDPAAREAAQMAALPAQVARAMATPALGAILAGVDAAAVRSRAALAALPVTRKSELLERQQAARAAGGDPFGGFSAIGWAALTTGGGRRGARRVFQSPGPIYEPEGEAADYWRRPRALCRGFSRRRPGAQQLQLPPDAGRLDDGDRRARDRLHRLPRRRRQHRAAAAGDARAAAPRLRRHAELPAHRAREGRRDGRRAAVADQGQVGGEAFPPALRDWLAARGIAAYQSYGTADLGLVAYETAAREGLVLDEGVIVEIVRPGTGEPVPDGEVGELVVTTLNPDYPLIRFGTGDLSAVLPGHCPTGRTNRASRAGWAAPTRPPRCAACSCTRARWPRC
jgi:phenylacetate-CoA ligase